jgi:hypothetical protein
MGIDPIRQRVNFCCTNTPPLTPLPHLHQCFLIALPSVPSRGEGKLILSSLWWGGENVGWHDLRLAPRG